MIILKLNFLQLPVKCIVLYLYYKYFFHMFS